MKPLFIISSALHTRFGIYSTEQRFQQTLDTINSIKERIPDAKIILNESSGEEAITESEAAILKPHLVALLSFTQDPMVRKIYQEQTTNWDIVKNFTEILVFGKSLDFILHQQPHLLNDVERVFKLSGRYQLTDDFSLDNFSSENLKDKYIFAQRRPSQFQPEITGGLTHQLMSRLWSFPANKMELVYQRYVIMLEHFTGMANKGLYVDIEHLLLKYFSGPFLVELPVIGVQGDLGPNGVTVKD